MAGGDADLGAVLPQFLQRLHRSGADALLERHQSAVDVIITHLLSFAKCIPVVVQPAQFSEVIFVGYFWRIVIDFDGNLAIIRTESFIKLQVQSQNTKGVTFPHVGRRTLRPHP